MRYNITTQDLKKSLGNVIDTVRLRGDRYIIERRGKPVAALVPLNIDQNYEDSRKRVFDFIDEVHRQNANENPEEIEAAIAEAIADVRRDKRAKLDKQS